MNFFGYGEQDFIPCEMCGSRAVDIHHIEKRNKTKNDYIENLIALCRGCHINAESDTSFNSYCRIQHLELVCRYIYALIDLNKKINESRK